MHRKWLVKRTNPEFVSYLSRAADISPPFAQILINRNLKTPEDVTSFFSQTINDMSDPFFIGGMEQALEAIKDAVRHGTRILVHGDYDADGLTATAILVDALRRLGLDVGYFIPNRFKDGYGFNPPAVIKAHESGVGLIITADCGISSFEAVELAKAFGIKIIVTDHHEPELDPETGKPVVPEALAVINPKLSHAETANLSGAGVILKLVQALGKRYPEISHLAVLDIASIGTLADSVPLLGENRTIVKEGLRQIQESRRPGIRALKSVSGLDGKSLTTGLLTFTLVPRINAAGRMSDASDVVELLLSESEEHATETATSLNRKNLERQQMEEKVLSEALAILEQKGLRPAIVLASEGWHEGVIGIVAAKIVERYARPTFILSISGESARGSARSIPRFDIFEGLSRCRNILKSFGGHPQAAGLRMNATDLEAFEEAISGIVAESVDDFTPYLNIDANIGLKDIKTRFVEELKRLEPFGQGNPTPVLGTKNLEVLDPRVVGKNHLKLKLRDRSHVVDAIGFNMGDLFPMVENSVQVDVAYSAGINEWQGTRNIQLTLKGIRPPRPED